MLKSNLQSFIRSNGIALPGCYPMALLMANGEVIDAKSARENYRLIRREDWEVEAVFIHWEGEPLICSHSGREITMKIKYFKTLEQAHTAIQPRIDGHYPNRFQDSLSDTRMKLVEYTRGFAWQKCDYGPYLTVGDFK